MSRMRKALFGFAAAFIAAGASPPAGAWTFARAGLDDLVAENETIVLGEVLGGRSYWSEAGTAGFAVSAWAEPVALVSQLGNLDMVEGSVVVRRAGQTLVMTLAGQETDGRWFRVEAAWGASLPAGFRAESAQILHWTGHLIFMAGDKAWHFFIPGSDAITSVSRQVPQAPDAAELASLLAGYQVTEVKASAIYSASGPHASRLNEGLRNVFEHYEPENQDPGSGGGNGGCGSSCSQTCFDGSSCSVTCSEPRCAHCLCPAACGCV